MTTIKVNTPTSPTEFPNSPGYCSKFIAWWRTHPIKAVIAVITAIIMTLIVSLVIYVTILYIRMGGPIDLMTGPPNGILGGTGN